MTKYFTRKRVVVKQDGVIVERYASLHAFFEAYPLGNYASVSKRVAQCVDGWMPDDKIARYFKDRNKDGREIVLAKVRDNQKMSEREEWRKDLRETEARIQEAYDLCDRGEITYEERAQRVGWLQNHAIVLRRRLGLKD